MYTKPNSPLYFRRSCTWKYSCNISQFVFEVTQHTGIRTRADLLRPFYAHLYINHWKRLIFEKKTTSREYFDVERSFF